MKKFTLLLTIAIFSLSAAVAQIQRNTLLEVFTSSTCGPCYPANINFENIIPTISDYTIIKYQMSWPGSGDPYYIAEGGARRSFYGVNSVPRMEIDGQWDVHAGSFSKTVFQSYNNIAAHVEFDFNSMTYDADTNITVDFDVIADQDYSTGYRVMVAIVEGKTTGNIRSNGETEFFYVFMGNLPHAGGSFLSSGLTKNVPHNISLTRDFGEEYLKGNTNFEGMNDLWAVVWVENTTTKVTENSDWIKLTLATNIGIEEEKSVVDVNVYPNPTSSDANIQFNLDEETQLTIEVKDVNGRLVHSYGNAIYPAGFHNLLFEGSEIPGGMYIVSFKTSTDVFTRKLMMNK